MPKKKEIWIKCIFCQKRNKECPDPLPPPPNPDNPHICLMYKGGKK